MNNTIFSAFSTARKTDRLICVWVPTGNPRTPLTCVWLEDKHYPAGCIVHSSSIEEARNEEAGRMQPCA
ncbi:MAG: hypothetical protein ACLQMO_11465 [Acidobacteriaceae bacterium]